MSSAPSCVVVAHRLPPGTTTVPRFRGPHPRRSVDKSAHRRSGPPGRRLGQAVHRPPGPQAAGTASTSPSPCRSRRRVSRVGRLSGRRAWSGHRLPGSRHARDRVSGQHTAEVRPLSPWPEFGSIASERPVQTGRGTVLLMEHALGSPNPAGSHLRPAVTWHGRRTPASAASSISRTAAGRHRQDYFGRPTPGPTSPAGHGTASPRRARHRRHLPAPGDARSRYHRRHRRRHVEWTKSSSVWARVVRRRAHRLRDPVPAARRALRPADRAA